MISRYCSHSQSGISSHSSIRRVYNVWGTVDEGGDGDGERWDWPAARWIDVLTRLAVEDGMDTFVFGPGRNAAVQLERWAEDVAPAVRVNVERARAR